ncbi:MAG: PD40 domain-containing protein [Bacteroidales bacterium]|nr:PD40 domain-containing protein [Bacteroidales bacterium]
MKRLILAMICCLLPVILASGQEQQAQKLLSEAVYQEEINGDLDEAIKSYQFILKNYAGNRKVSAKALLHLGLCYEKLGSGQAQQAYRQLIKEYSENREEVSIARDRLAKLEQVLADLNNKPEFRKIEFASNPQNGVLSPDGKKLAFTSENGLWLVPLQGNVGTDIAGEPVCIAEIPGAIDFYNVMAWTTNGRWIALNGGGAGADDVYIVPTTGGEVTKISLPKRGAGYLSSRLSLSPDGQNLLFSSWKPELDGNVPEIKALYVYMVNTKGGKPKQISSGPGTFPVFSPDGNFIAYVTYYEKEKPPENIQGTRFNTDLWITKTSGGTPIRLAEADGRLSGPVWSPDGRFLAATGRTDAGGKEIWIYELFPDASGVNEPAIIDLPRYNLGMLAGWTPENELGVFIRSESHEAIYTVPSSGGRAVQVTPDGVVYYPRWSPDGGRIYLRWVKLNEDPPVQIGYVPADGGNITIIPWPGMALMSRVPGGGHNISPDGKTLIVNAAEKPYGSTQFMDLHMIPLDGSQPVRLTHDESNEIYPCWSPDGKWIAFVEWKETSNDNGFNVIYRIPAEGGEPIAISSSADNIGGGAIAFSPDGRSIAFFSEGKIKTIPVAGGETSDLVNDVQSTRHSNLVWSPDGSKIAYNADGRIWITTLATGEKTALKTGLPESFWASEFDWSPDGEKITFMIDSGDEPEFHLISNFLPLVNK